MNKTINPHLILKLVLANTDVKVFMDQLLKAEFEVPDDVVSRLVDRFLEQKNVEAIVRKLNENKQYIKGN